MYDKIGSKIKKLAVWVCVIMSLLGIVTGIALWAVLESAIFGLLILVVPFFSWISSWLLYGFGELIDKTCNIDYELIKLNQHFCKPENQNTNVHTTENKTEIKTESEIEVKTDDPQETARIEKLTFLYTKGLITKEDYLQAISAKGTYCDE